MTTAVQYGSLACVAGGVVAGLVAVLTTRNGQLALRVALDLWLAAGLLRLALPPAWEEMLAVTAVVAVRQLVAGRGTERRPGGSGGHRRGSQMMWPPW